MVQGPTQKRLAGSVRLLSSVSSPQLRLHGHAGGVVLGSLVLQEHAFPHLAMLKGRCGFCFCLFCFKIHGLLALKTLDFCPEQDVKHSCKCLLLISGLILDEMLEITCIES